ncbi:MAG: MFS transporter [Propionicimonas sp.]|uniref:MFS transporter n=1 Tax=Propionicimonas sp. TaxID=1955623 RepID=UPI003D1316C4
MTTATPATLTRGRVVAAVVALSLGGFGIGVTEFVAMGLLPSMAQDLLPAQWAASPAVATATAGHLISAYALGVVVGAPVLAALGARAPRKTLLVGFLVGFVGATSLAAVLPSFGLVLAARFVAGLPHGAYFGIASVVASDLLGPGNKGRAGSFILAGLTIANIVGVPTITWAGQVAGWRIAYTVVAAVFAVALGAVAWLVPHQPPGHGASVRRELAAFRNVQVWVAIGIGAIGTGGFFAVYSYVSPLVTGSAGMGAGAVPWALVTTGLGMTIGNLLGGWLADRGTGRAILILGVSSAVTLTLIGLLARTPLGVFGTLLLLGVTSMALAPTVQARLMHAAREAEGLGASLNHAAMNIGNALGAFLGGIALATTGDARNTAWVGLILCVLGIALTAVGIRLERTHPVDQP